MEELVVNVEQGKLRGCTVKSVLGDSYFAFKGIPFAAPPIGHLRFKDPEPPAPWSGIRDASEHSGVACAQKNYLPPNEILGSEDCLYLNVYTTTLHDVRPVLVWIHGGGFYSGSGNYFYPDYLITRDVVVVCINYRVGALGFLNLDHEVAPGNQGMKDQVAALKWIKRNIRKFGGDDGNVTIFGASAGAAAVHLHMLSPMSKGLFHKVILQSGTATCSWALGESRPERCFKLAEILGIKSKDPVEVVERLRSIPVEDLVRAQSKILTPDEVGLFHLPFGVNIDAVSKNPFLPCPLHELRSNAEDIPFMTGFTSHEFIMFLTDSGENTLKWMDEHFVDFIRKVVQTRDDDKVAGLSKEIRKWYFGDEPMNKKNIPSLVNFLSDIHIVNPTLTLVDERRNRTCAPTYLYTFSYVGNESTATKARMQSIPMTGASHVDDTTYLFYIPRYKTKNPDAPSVGTKDRVTMERLTRMWANFAKTGNPTSTLDEYVTTAWKPVTKEDLNYMDIGDELKNSVAKMDVIKIFEKYV